MANQKNYLLKIVGSIVDACLQFLFFFDDDAGVVVVVTIVSLSIKKRSQGCDIRIK